MLPLGNFKKSVGKRQVSTRVHTQSVELLLGMVTFRVRSKRLSEDLKGFEQ